MAFSLEAFKAKRLRQRLIGAIMFWGGLLFLMADVTTNFPTPMKGQYALWWLAVVGFGAWSWIRSKRLPLEETIEIARQPSYFGEMRITELTSELNVSLETAEEILTALTRKGFARMEDRGEICVWVFPEVKSAGPMVRRAASHRESESKN